MPPVGFEPTVSAGERPQTYALDRAATAIGTTNEIQIRKTKFLELELFYSASYFFFNALS